MLHVHPLYFIYEAPDVACLSSAGLRFSCLLRNQAMVKINVYNHAQKRFAGRTDSCQNYVLVACYVSLYPINTERDIQVDVDHTNTLKHWT